MSEALLRVGVVAEGPTDTIVIEAILAACGREFVVTQLQPESSDFAGDAGPRGNGWLGVQRWCEGVRTGGGLEATGAFAVSDLLIVHVDADIAHDDRVACVQTCPPASDTVDALRTVLLTWLGEADWSPKTMPCIPTQATEAWVFVALAPNDTLAVSSLECRDDPATLLVPRKLVRRKDGRLKKLVPAYRAAMPAFLAAWPHVCSVLPEAQRFQTELMGSIAAADLVGSN